jgi:hypothetical protein
LNFLLSNRKSAIGNRHFLLRLFVIRVLAATLAELAKLKPIGRGLLVLSRRVIPVLAVVALQHNIIAWHELFPIGNCRLPI